MVTIDLNSDLGENTPDRVVGDDAAMLDLVSSANVAAGFHAGDPMGIRTTVAAAHERGVAIGAHPGYRDYANFGRVDLELSAAEAQADVEYQLGAVLGLAAAVGARVRYVKPHGALYNRIAHDEALAEAVVAAVRAVDPSLVFLGIAGGVCLDVAERAGLTAAREAFADRAYQPDGTLMPRTQEGSVLHDPGTVAERILRLVHDGVVEAADGSLLRLDVDSICVHGDSPGAVAMAGAVRARLVADGVTIAPFAGASS